MMCILPLLLLTALVLLLLLPTAAVAAQLSRIAMGPAHAAAIQPDGTAYAWGLNAYGQLGDGTLTTRTSPVLIRRQSRAAVHLSAGSHALCMLDSAGQVKCAGVFVANPSGYDRKRPKSWMYPLNKKSKSKSESVKVACGWSHVCVLSAKGGKVRCLGGDNQFGQLGRGYAKQHPSHAALAPVAELPVRAVIDLALGQDFTCVVGHQGKVFCVGKNEFGAATGEGAGAMFSAKWTEIRQLGGKAVAVACGQAHACATLATGQVKCWGSNSEAQLSERHAADISGSYKPVWAYGLYTSKALKLTAGAAATCAIDSKSRQVACLGERFTKKRWPQTADAVTQVAVGDYSACMIMITSKTTHHQVFCSREDDYSTTTPSSEFHELVEVKFPALPQQPSPPLIITPARPVRKLAVGNYHSAFIQDGGQAFTWGLNSRGQLGVVWTDRYSASPVRMLNLPGTALDVCVGDRFTCVLVSVPAAREEEKEEDGGGTRVKCTGRMIALEDEYGSRDLYDYEQPYTIKGELYGRVSRIECGAYHACALTTRGAVACWGRNVHAELGGTNSSTKGVEIVAVPMSGGAAADQYVQASLGQGFTCLLTPSGRVKCVGGQNPQQQSGSDPWTAGPVLVTGLPSHGDGGVIALAAAYHHVCALVGVGGGGGQVWCWGHAVSGYTTVPQRVPVFDSVVPFPFQFAASKYSTCVVTGQQLQQNPSAMCVKSFEKSYEYSAGGELVEVASSLNNTCVVVVVKKNTRRQEAQCLGSDRYGQLGNGQQGSQGDGSTLTRVQI